MYVLIHCPSGVHLLTGRLAKAHNCGPAPPPRAWCGQLTLVFRVSAPPPVDRLTTTPRLFSQTPNPPLTIVIRSLNARMHFPTLPWFLLSPHYEREGKGTHTNYIHSRQVTIANFLYFSTPPRRPHLSL